MSTTKTHRKTVKYISNIKEDRDSDKFPVYRKVEISVSHIKIYDDAFPLLANLTTCARTLIDFLTREMDLEGIVRNDWSTKERFSNKIRHWTDGRIKYGDATINIAFSDLAKKKLLIPLKRGIYRVNPEYFYRNSDVNREASIKGVYELKTELDE